MEVITKDGSDNKENKVTDVNEVPSVVSEQTATQEVMVGPREEGTLNTIIEETNRKIEELKLGLASENNELEDIMVEAFIAKLRNDAGAMENIPTNHPDRILVDGWSAFEKTVDEYFKKQHERYNGRTWGYCCIGDSISPKNFVDNFLSNKGRSSNEELRKKLIDIVNGYEIPFRNGAVKNDYLRRRLKVVIRIYNDADFANQRGANNKPAPSNDLYRMGELISEAGKFKREVVEKYLKKFARDVYFQGYMAMYANERKIIDAAFDMPKNN